MDLIRMSPADFTRFLRSEGIGRFFLVVDGEGRRLVPSHPVLRPLADRLSEDRRDFLGHEGLFFQITRRHDTLQGAFIHRTCRGQAAGGVRFWRYDTMEDYLRDGLRLAVGMTRKNALAGIWWGGGKGVMVAPPEVARDDPQVRASIYREYGELITSIRGCYVTAEDVGTSVSDMARVFETTRFTTCIPPALGGSGNPSVPTARGVICGMEAALEFAGTPGLAGRTVAVQGCGHVGEPLIGYLLEKKVSKILACDIDPDAVKRVMRSRPGAPLEARAVGPDDDWIVAQPCDVFAPCATGAVLNPRTIAILKARIVCGAANNQLEDPVRDDQLLADRGVLYVPDFLTNRMGIVTCADEQAGYTSPDPLIERHLSRDWEFSIHRMTLEILQRARATGDPPSAVATARADELSLRPHPIFGHRGRAIIRDLAASGWHDAPRVDAARS